MKIIIAIVLVTSLFLSCSSSQNTTSTPYRPKNVKIYSQTSRNTLGPCEPSICIDPTNLNNIVAGSVLNYVHTSNDGGLTWKTKELISEFGVWGDPSIVADTNGGFYYFHLSDPDGTNWKSKRILDRIVMQKSIDKGTSWSPGTSIGLNKPKQQDKQWAAINPKTNDLYVTWTEFDKYSSTDSKDKSRILFSKSTNKGDSWSKPLAISTHEGDCKDDDYTTEGSVPVSDGKNIYTSWSFDKKIWFNKSLDNGKTWLKNALPIANQNAGWRFIIPGVNRANGFPITSVDLSKSKYKGTIYVNWSDQSNENNTDVFIAKSINEGKTWSKPQLVHNETPNTHQFFNWMSVDPSTGYIYIVYYSQLKNNEHAINVELAVSKDGAKTFKNYTISENSFDPRGANFFGDYNNIDAKNGIIRPVWTQTENKLVSIWTAIINEEDLK